MRKSAALLVVALVGGLTLQLGGVSPVSAACAAPTGTTTTTAPTSTSTTTTTPIAGGTTTTLPGATTTTSTSTTVPASTTTTTAPPTTGSAADRCFVEAAYQDLLGRAPTTTESDAAVAKLAAGTSRQTFALSLSRTPEWARVVVTELYRTVLGRSTDAGGLTYWSTRLAGGERTADLASLLYASNEFYRKAGGTNPTYVTEVYQNLLKRAPDQTGLNFWVGRLDAGAPRTTIARQFFLSIESNGRRVDQLYQVLLGRASEAGGRAFWAQQLVTKDDLTLAGLLVGSNEYYRKAQTGGSTTTSTTTTPSSTSTTAPSTTSTSTTSTSTTTTTMVP